MLVKLAGGARGLDFQFREQDFAALVKLLQGFVPLAEPVVAAHEPLVNVLPTIVLRQDVLAQGDGGGALAEAAVVGTQAVENQQVNLLEVFAVQGAPILVQVFFHEVAGVEGGGHFVFAHGLR